MTGKFNSNRRASVDLRSKGIPGVLVCGAGRPIFSRWGEALIDCIETGSQYIHSLDERSRKPLAQTIERRVEELAGRGLHVWGGPLKRVKSVDCFLHAGLTGRMTLLLEDTNYLEFLATNHDDGVNGPLASERRSGELAALDQSTLANPLTVTVNVVTGDGYVIVQRRNVAKAAHATYPWQASFAGMVNPDVDLGEHGIDPFATAVREASEEMGLAIRAEDVAFFGLAREAKHLEVGLVGHVEVAGSRSELEPVLHLAEDEVSGIEFVKLSAGNMLKFIDLIGGAASIVPLAHIAIALSAGYVTIGRD
jgi:hypothetical protein